MAVDAMPFAVFGTPPGFIEAISPSCRWCCLLTTLCADYPHAKSVSNCTLQTTPPPTGRCSAERRWWITSPVRRKYSAVQARLSRLMKAASVGENTIAAECATQRVFFAGLSGSLAGHSSLHVPMTPSPRSFTSSHIWTGRSGLRTHRRHLLPNKQPSNVAPPLSISPSTQSSRRTLTSDNRKLH